MFPTPQPSRAGSSVPVFCSEFDRAQVGGLVRFRVRALSPQRPFRYLFAASTFEAESYYRQALAIPSWATVAVLVLPD